MPSLTKKTRREYAVAPTSEQPRYLSAALKHSQTAFGHLLFVYCVNEYKLAPTKKKALFIWDTFLASIGTTNVPDDFNAIDLNVDECGTPALHTSLKNWITTLRTMRETAQRTNRITRFFTSADRTAPHNLFNDWVEAMLSRKGDTAWTDIEGRLHLEVIAAPSIYTNIKAKMPEVKTRLQDAGLTGTAGAVPVGT
jgi:hypothetical protein